MGCIYLARNIANGKRYVGKTRMSLAARIKEHVKRSRLGSQLCFHKAIRKYGVDGFSWSVLFNGTSETDLEAQEILFIQQMKSRVPSGYNMTDGGEGGLQRSVSAATREKLRAAQLGRLHTEESRRKMSQQRRGVPKSATHLTAMRSPEYKEKLRAKAIVRTHTIETKAKLSRLWLGRKHTEETKRKMSIIAIKRWSER